MIIRFERTGGFAAIPLRLEIDTDRLETSEHQNLHGMVENSRFFSLPVHMPQAGSGVDRFHYRLTIVESGHSHTVETGEANLPETLQPLIQRLILLARSQHI